MLIIIIFQIRGYIHQLEEKYGNFYLVVMILKVHLKNVSRYSNEMVVNIVFLRWLCLLFFLVSGYSGYSWWARWVLSEQWSSGIWGWDRKVENKVSAFTVLNLYNMEDNIAYQLFEVLIHPIWSFIFVSLCIDGIGVRTLFYSL